MNRDTLIRLAPAKINLFLRVTGRRTDGYHTLDTLMQKLTLFDRLELRPLEEGIRLHCPDSDLAQDGSNLVYRAAALFLARAGGRISGNLRGVELRLFKTIPVAAGLGGGSSDAAATLKGMNDLFRTGCSREELAEMGLELGADVPFFVASFPAARATGIGEVLTPAAGLAGYLVLLVNPGFSVSTRWVYQNLALTPEKKEFNLNSSRNDDAGPAGTPPQRGPDFDVSQMTNDLERVTASRHRELTEIKDFLLHQGARAAMMSGSGPTVFGLFPEQEADRARRCLDLLRQQYPHVFLVQPICPDQSASGGGCIAGTPA